MMLCHVSIKYALATSKQGETQFANVKEASSCFNVELSEGKREGFLFE